MIEKIISGGQTGVEQAGLDVAMRLGIEYGGWVPVWRQAEDEKTVSKYHLQLMPHGNFFKATLENVLDSDGTLIVSQGQLMANAALSRRLAEKHNRPWIHADLDRVVAFQAAQKINDWIKTHRIKVLNITGPQKVKGLNIYKITTDILETVLHLSLIDSAYDSFHAVHETTEKSEPEPVTDPFPDIPKSLDNAVDMLLSRLSFKQKTKIANISEERLFDLTASLRIYIKTEFRMLEDDDAASAIIKKLWETLQSSDTVLRIVK